MNKELGFVKDMFDKIAPQYDFLNRLLSLRQDVVWRTQMVKAARVNPGGQVLDVACGTCDVAVEVLKQLKGQITVTGVDFSVGMLKLGLKKTSRHPQIGLVNGDALRLPFGSGTVDTVMIAFGIRNIMNRQGALEEFARVLKDGGRLAVLELTTPEKGFLRGLYLTYFQKILPLIGSFFSKDAHAYSYLPASVIRFPPASKFAGIMAGSGYTDIRFKPMTMGIVTLFVGTKG